MDRNEAEIRYGDIINREHFRSEKRQPMAAAARAAQFAPYAALTGYDEGIRESARYVERKAVLDEQEIARIDRELQRIREKLRTQPAVTVSYFERDKRKAGGFYITVTGRVREIEPYLQVLLLTDGTEIPLQDICGIERLDEE